MSKPNIMFIATAFGVRSEVWMYRHATRMRNSHVTVLCREHRNTDLYPATDDCDVRVLPTSLVPSAPVRLLGSSMPVRLLGSVWNRMRNLGYARFSGSPAVRKWFVDQYAELTPAATLIQYGTTATSYAGLLQTLGQPYAIHFHGHDLSQAVRDPRYARKIIRAGRGAKALIVVAEYMREWLVDNGIDAAKVHRVPYGVPMQLFRPKELGESTGDATGESRSVEFLMVGRLTQKKAPELTIRAFAETHRQHPNSTLRIIGDGDLLSQCQQLVGELAINDSVHFMGSRSTDEVRDAMRNASVFVQHSVTSPTGDREGWPVAIAEAAGSGLPIISTRHASIPEQVLDGETGLLCDEHDLEAMTQNMKQLAGDAGLREQFGRRSREHISQWDTDAQIEKLERILLGAVDS